VIESVFKLLQLIILLPAATSFNHVVWFDRIMLSDHGQLMALNNNMFHLQFVGASMGTSNLRVPLNNSSHDVQPSLPSRACCVVVEYISGGNLKQFLIRNRRKKLPFKVVIQLALDLARG